MLMPRAPCSAQRSVSLMQRSTSHAGITGNGMKRRFELSCSSDIASL
jgi:hypothetical protein